MATDFTNGPEMTNSLGHRGHYHIYADGHKVWIPDAAHTDSPAPSGTTLLVADPGTGALAAAAPVAPPPAPPSTPAPAPSGTTLLAADPGQGNTLEAAKSAAALAQSAVPKAYTVVHEPGGDWHEYPGRSPVWVPKAGQQVANGQVVTGSSAASSATLTHAPVVTASTAQHTTGSAPLHGLLNITDNKRAGDTYTVMHENGGDIHHYTSGPEAGKNIWVPKPGQVVAGAQSAGSSGGTSSSTSVGSSIGHATSSTQGGSGHSSGSTSGHSASSTASAGGGGHSGTATSGSSTTHTVGKKVNPRPAHPGSNRKGDIGNIGGAIVPGLNIATLPQTQLSKKNHIPWTTLTRRFPTGGGNAVLGDEVVSGHVVHPQPIPGQRQLPRVTGEGAIHGSATDIAHQGELSAGRQVVKVGTDVVKATSTGESLGEVALTVGEDAVGGLAEGIAGIAAGSYRGAEGGGVAGMPQTSTFSNIEHAALGEFGARGGNAAAEGGAHNGWGDGTGHVPPDPGTMPTTFFSEGDTSVNLTDPLKIRKS